ncbi:DUF777 family protein [Borreliella burgdorferi]|uniref:DUF777 family protein n=2 Tax=Borreliella burgdorferi TaxID=139 RepID=UPI00017F384E|nr:DUF777 family protein [Borreliella burgdorferi]ACN55509.1 conserved hypothetical protein [Borreliella burgdorferi WI91-23]
MCDLRKTKLIDKISSLELYKYSIFFRNYIENVAEDCLKNGLILESAAHNVSEVELARLKVQLKNALLNCIISYRFHGIGYVLVKTKDTLIDLEQPVNIELPIGFEYLDYEYVRDLGIDFDHITYKVKSNNKNNSLDAVKIHKSRLIIYENFDYILKRYVPCYTESFLLDIYLFEKIYVEIERRIENHNFLFYKDESLVQLQDALSSATTSLSALTQSNNDKRLYGNTLTQEDVKNWIYSNIFIIKIGTVKEFKQQTQEAIVTIPEFEDLEIHTKNISNIGLELSKGDTVLLLQSSVNIFDKNDDIHFDKNHFYILSAISPKTLNLISDTVKIKANNKIEIANEVTTLKSILESIVSAIEGIKVVTTKKGPVIEPVSLKIATTKINSDINSLFK